MNTENQETLPPTPSFWGLVADISDRTMTVAGADPDAAVDMLQALPMQTTELFQLTDGERWSAVAVLGPSLVTFKFATETSTNAADVG